MRHNGTDPADGGRPPGAPHAGVSNVDLDGARELGIEVRATADAPTAAVAEMTVGAMIALLRQVPRMDRELREGRWTRRTGTQVAGKTIAIIGYGRIGRRVAALLQPSVRPWSSWIPQGADPSMAWPS